MKRATPLLLLSALVAGCGTDVSGPSAALFACAFGDAAALAVGEVVQVQGDAHRAVCVAPADSGGIFLHIPFYAARPATGGDAEVELDVRLSGSGLSPVSLPPGFERSRAGATDPTAPFRLPDGATGATGGSEWARDHGFHDRLRRREVEELGPRIRPGSPGALPTAAAVAEPPVVGALREYNVAVSCTETQLRTGRVMAVTDHAVVVADTSNPADLTPDDYTYFGVTFDTLVYPVSTAHFGEPTDIDGNGRSILFFTGAVNERNPAGATSVVIGFFWSGDLFPEQDTPRLQACPAANQAEMFYLIAPDPNGVLGPSFDLSTVRNLAIPLIGHEYQHLINASRRLFVNEASTFEETWLNEGLSHVAEELLFFAASGLEPGANLDIDDLRSTPGAVDAFNEYMAPNFSNFRQYLASPDTASLMGSDLLTTRGATWAFLRYAADRSARGDEAFFFDLVNSQGAGLGNLADVPGIDSPLDWMRDWTVSVYADDFVPGVDDRFRQASWNLRSIYANSTVGVYPLEVLELGSGPLLVDLLAGGAAFARFGVNLDGRGVVQVEAGDGPPPAALRGSVLRVR